MKKILNTIICAALVGGLVSCGNKEQEEKEKAEIKSVGSALGSLMKMGKEMEKSQKESQGKLAERRAKGDTLAMPYAELQKLLPATIEGFKTEEPNGGSVNMTGMSYSNAEGKYTKGGEWVKISIVDYNQAYGLYSAATAMWAMGMSVDTPNEKANGMKLDDNIGGWEVYQKKTKKAAVTLGVGERFWVNVEASGQENTEWVKSIAKSIDLSKLAAM